MFQFGKTKIPTGARAKIELAKQMRAAGRYNVNQQGGGDTRYPSQTIAITLIFALAVILAFLLTGGSSNPLSGMHLTGISSVDSFVTGSDIPTFTGDPDQDRVITIMGRGLAFFALAGFVPLIAWALEHLFFNKIVMPLVLCWGVIVVMIMLYLFVPADSIAPFFKGIVPFFKSL
jgi:hypothetical protein